MPEQQKENFPEMMLDANSAILSNGAPTHQDRSAGGFSTLDVTIIHKSLQEIFDWSLCDSLPSGLRPITITLSLPAEQLKGKKQLVCDWKKGNLRAITAKLKARYPKSTRAER